MVGSCPPGCSGRTCPFLLLHQNLLAMSSLSGYAHIVYESHDTALVLLQALLRLLQCSGIWYCHAGSQILPTDPKCSSLPDLQLAQTPHFSASVLPVLDSCSGLHQIQVPDANQQSQDCTGTWVLLRLVKPFYCSKKYFLWSTAHCINNRLSVLALQW